MADDINNANLIINRDDDEFIWEDEESLGQDDPQYQTHRKRWRAVAMKKSVTFCLVFLLITLFICLGVLLPSDIILGNNLTEISVMDRTTWTAALISTIVPLGVLIYQFSRRCLKYCCLNCVIGFKKMCNRSARPVIGGNE